MNRLLNEFYTFREHIPTLLANLVDHQIDSTVRRRDRTHLIEDIHDHKTLFVSPQITLKFPIPHTPSHFVSLVMQARTDVVEHFLFLPNDFTAPGPVKVLDGERLGAIDGRLDQDVAVAVPDGYSWVRFRERDGAAEDRLSLEGVGEVEREGCGGVDACDGGFEHRAADSGGSGVLVRWVLV